MTNNFNIGELVRIATTLLNAKSNGQAFMLTDVHSITRAAYEQYPEDPVINQVAFTIERMAEKAPAGATISQSALSGIYNNFVRLSSNSKFREVLGHLLLEETQAPSTQSSDYAKLNRVDGNDSELNTDSLVDTNLANAISSTFTGSIDSVKAFDNSVAIKGKELVSAELQTIGFAPALEIMGGNLNNIVYAAHFETNKGRITLAIPTEISNGRVLFPSVFVADDHFEELTATNVSSFISKKSSVCDFSVPKTADILSAVRVITGKAKTASDSEFSKLQEVFGGKEKEMELSVSNLFVNQKQEYNRPDIDTHQNVAMPQELVHLARDFEDDVLEAASAFGLETIQTGRNMVASELRTAGFKNAQVKFGSESNDTVVYLAYINTPKGLAEIEVPVEMKSIAENKFVPLAPTYFAYDGLIEDFSATKLQRFAIRLPDQSTKSVIHSTAFTYMLLPELREEILKAASDSDYITCESILNEVQGRFSEEDFKNAVSDYHFILMQKSKLGKQEQTKCSKMIAAGKGSIYPRCGHFGVPMNQVVSDEQGNCRLKTAMERERLNPADETSAAISTSKIFMS
jgi:hypothetical protein